MAITADEAVFERIRQVLDDSDDPVDLIRSEDPSQLGEEDAISGVAVIGLHCHTDNARARRELRGLRLGCWCEQPGPCHGHNLCEVADADIDDDADDAAL